MKVHLSPADLMLAAYVGVRRTVSSIVRGLTPGAGAIVSGNRWQMDIEGALAEMAVAKGLGVFWDGSLDRFSGQGGDVLDFQIRSSTEHDRCLIVRPGDEDRVFVFVTGQEREYWIRGWITNEGAKQERYLRAPNGRPAAYFVPPRDLYPIEDLKAKGHG